MAGGCIDHCIVIDDVNDCIIDSAEKYLLGMDERTIRECVGVFEGIIDCRCVVV